MKAVLPITVEDLAKFKTMAVATPRAARAVAPASKLAPVEMAQPSVTFAPAQPKAAPPAPCQDPPAPGAAVAPGWIVPCAYGACGTCMALCSLVAPGACLECAQLVCPLWTCATVLHAATQADLWRWWGVLAAALLPFALLLADASFLALYACLFTLFALGNSWNTIHGPALIALYACACGALAGAVSSVGVDRPRAQLSIGGYCMVGCAVICTLRLGRLSFRVGPA